MGLVRFTTTTYEKYYSGQHIPIHFFAFQSMAQFHK